MKRSVPGRHIGGVTDQVGFDLHSWPTPDVGALSPEKRAAYLRRRKAVEMCVEGAASTAIKAECGIGLQQVTRLMKERCMLAHPDGQIFGFRGLLPHLRIKPYTRSKPVAVDKFGRGGAGAMKSLLDSDPEFRRMLDKRILASVSKNELSEVKRPRQALWGWFLEELRTRQYEIRRDWPFGRNRQVPDGYGALCRYADALLKQHPRVIARNAGEKADRKLRAGDGVDRPVQRGFQRVEMDSHKLDGRFCVLMPDGPDRWVPRIIHRLWVTVIVETYSRAVLGYYLSLGREVPKRDILRTIKRALTRWVPIPVTFGDTALAEGAGLPSALGDRFVGLCWDETSVDGALAETCRSVKEQLRDVVGSALLEPQNSFSVRRSLDDRPFVESFFRVLGDRGLQRLSNSTGSRPDKRIVKAPDDVAMASQFQYEYIEELLQCLICNYNATPHSALGYRSPLQMLQYLADRGTLTERKADPTLVQGMLSFGLVRTVKGGAAEGRQPYVNFCGARYGGPAITDREDLVGTKVWVVNHVEDDARVARCSTTSGTLIGILRAAPPWDKLPHSLAVRRSIQSLVTVKRLASLGSDAIRSFIGFVEARPDKKLPVHPAYLELRRILWQQSQNFEGDKAAQRAMRALTGMEGGNPDSGEAPHLTEEMTRLPEAAEDGTAMVSPAPPPACVTEPPPKPGPEKPPPAQAGRSPKDGAAGPAGGRGKAPSEMKRPLPARRLAAN